MKKNIIITILIITNVVSLVNLINSYKDIGESYDYGSQMAQRVVAEDIIDVIEGDYTKDELRLLRALIDVSNKWLRHPYNRSEETIHDTEVLGSLDEYVEDLMFMIRNNESQELMEEKEELVIDIANDYILLGEKNREELGENNLKWYLHYKY